jgi:drug/metabolite transporter (DMT)-like permease
MLLLQHVSAPMTALDYTAMLLWCAVFAWFLLGEGWEAVGWVGCPYSLWVLP